MVEKKAAYEKYMVLCFQSSHNIALQPLCDEIMDIFNQFHPLYESEEWTAFCDSIRNNYFSNLYPKLIDSYPQNTKEQIPFHDERLEHAKWNNLSDELNKDWTLMKS